MSADATTHSERHALVIGAGLAGAAVCAALARKGWALTLVDAASGPASAASSLPVGMLSPHVTRAPTPMSRLSLLGVADTRRELERLVPQGSGWQACEVDNLGHDAGRWPAALVRPAALVQAWLEEASRLTRLNSHWLQQVARLVQTADGGWAALNTEGVPIAQAPVVVICAAFDSLALLRADGLGLSAEATPLRPVKGQLTLAHLTGEPLAECPQRDNGVHVPNYADTGLAPRWPERIWAMGSTYHRGETGTEVTEAGHRLNHQSLEAINPAAAARLIETARSGQLLGWAQVRCASLDRLPMVGAVPDPDPRATQLSGDRGRRRPPLESVPRLRGAYVLTAMGSRGITLAHWCAGVLAAQIEGTTPQAAPADLIEAIDPARFAWRHARKQGI